MPMMPPAPVQVLDHHRLAERFLQLRCEQAPERRSRRPGERHDDADRPVGPVLRERREREELQQDEEAAFQSRAEPSHVPRRAVQ